MAHNRNTAQLSGNSDRVKTSDAARVIGVSVPTLQNWIRHGRYHIPHQIVGGHAHFSLRQLERWKREHSRNEYDETTTRKEHGSPKGTFANAELDRLIALDKPKRKSKEVRRGR
jgi:phage terminase Nu1 subunit (DNA packaging protein)